MATRKKGLGRGLDALLGSKTPTNEKTEVPVSAPAGEQRTPSGERLVRLPVEQLRRGRYQPRREMDPEGLEELAESIRGQGVMQPIVARPLADPDAYEIIAGERRWRAAQIAGMDAVPVIVREIGDDAAIAMALIENIQREDLNPIDEAMALQRLADEFELTQEEIAKTVGKSRSTIANLLRLLKLAPSVRELLETRKLEMGHARALLTLEPDVQQRIARDVVARGLSVRQTEALARAPRGDGDGKTAAPAADPDQARLERSLSDTLGAPVRIEHGKGGAGRLVIRYTSVDELEGILSHIK